MRSHEEVKRKRDKILEQVDENIDSRYAERNSRMTPAEFYFVLDRSGSMAGTPIRVALDALRLFIRSLPSGSRFNVISFGSEFTSMFESPVEYTKANIKIALEELSTFKANMAGTEIYQPLQNIFTSKSTSALKKYVYLITDGGVTNEADVVKLIE